ncbi:MAG: hypothetical protein JNL26_01635, partial [Gemmatimonadetes bacterium]|nr:hypothetical protein [Gemmatimonadota bacterium]
AIAALLRAQRPDEAARGHGANGHRPDERDAGIDPTHDTATRPNRRDLLDTGEGAFADAGDVAAD